MKVSMFIPVAAFVLAAAGAIANNVSSQSTIWLYSNGQTTTGTPDCLEDPTQICATLHFFDPSQPDNVGDPVLDENGDPIEEEGRPNNP